MSLKDLFENAFRSSYNFANFIWPKNNGISILEVERKRK